MIKKYNLLLVGIFALGLVLRLYQLGNYPALNADEAALGYNAYSLLETGKDEHGNSWPIHFQSFNDYKPGLTVYLILPFVKLFGLNIWSVRIFPMFLSSLTILAIYYLVQELFSNRRFSLLSALFLSISPWHIHFSRGAWEVSIETFFMTFGMWSFLRARSSPKLYLLSVLVFAASLYTYHSARLVTPLLGLGLLVFQYKNMLNDKAIIGLSIGLGIIVLTPLILDLMGPAGISRASGVGITADMGTVSRINEQRGEHANQDGLWTKALHNKLVNFGLVFTKNWSDHYWGEFLFNSGDEIQRNKVPEMGQMYIFDIIFILIGFAGIVKLKVKNNWKLVIWWLIVAPVASALTFQSPHALRAHNMVIPMVIISAYGFSVMMNRIHRVGLILFIVLIVLGVSRYLHLYWVHTAKAYPYSSQYGVSELVGYLSGKTGEYKKILVTDRYDQPYILFLFYSKFPPEKFQQEHVLTDRDRFGFSTVREFGNYHFERIDFEKIRGSSSDSLIVGTSKEIPSDANIVKTIAFPNGEDAFRVVEN